MIHRVNAYGAAQLADDTCQGYGRVGVVWKGALATSRVFFGQTQEAFSWQHTLGQL
jgi:hypothetical protein